MRQLEQDVGGFWNFCMGRGNRDPQLAEHIAAKIIGLRVFEDQDGISRIDFVTRAER